MNVCDGLASYVHVDASSDGVRSPGMSKDQVLMTLGYPPADRTPSLEASTWTYDASPSQTFTVSFDGGKVTQVTRPR